MEMGVKCTSCNKRDLKNRFKEREVSIVGEWTTSSGTAVSATKTFTCLCAECHKCHKILFDDMNDFYKLKRKAELSFIDEYGMRDLKMTEIALSK